MKLIKFYIISLFFLNCLAGAFIDKGGHVDSMYLTNSATNVYRNNFYVICLKSDNQNPEEEMDISKKIQYIPFEQYKGGCEQYGEVSQFYLFHLFPTSDSLDPEYAINTVVQKFEGDTMINIRGWHETHYYSLLGQVRVFKVKGDVIKFAIPEKK